MLTAQQALCSSSTWARVSRPRYKTTEQSGTRQLYSQLYWIHCVHPIMPAAKMQNKSGKISPSPCANPGPAPHCRERRVSIRQPGEHVELRENLLGRFSVAHALSGLQD